MTTQLVGLTSSHPEESRQWAGLAMAILKRMGPGHEKLEGWLEQDRANAAYDMGDVQTATGLYARAVALKTAAEGAEHADVALSLMSYGNVLHEQGDDEGGLSVLARAETIFERAYGPSNRFVAMALNNEGEILNALSRAREALAKFEKAIAILSRDVAPKTYWTAYPLTGKGRSLLALGHPGEAVAPLSAALEVRDRGETLPLPRGETRFALARALWESGGDRARARALASSARDEYRRATSAGKNVAEIDAWLATHRRG
jgi:eukaryotic-like serine/threonine-protein kinase